MVAYALKSGQMEISPLSMAVREHLRRHKISVVEMAERIGMNRVTLQSRMTKQTPLLLGSPKDMELVRRIAKELDIPMAEIVDTANRMALGPSKPNNPDMVWSLIEILRNPNVSDEAKDRAQRALLGMLEVDPE